MTKVEFEVWASRILSVCQLKCQGEIDEFCNLLSRAPNQIDAEVVRVLLRTFSDVDDYGIQEQTRNIVQSADKHVYYPILLDKLQGLVDRSPEKEWALTLLGMEFQYGKPELLLDLFKTRSKETQEFFRQFVSAADFMDEYAEAVKFVKGL